MREEGLLHELGMVLLPNPVPSHVVLNSVLENHHLQHLLGFGVREPALGDKIRNALGQCMYPLTGLLPNIGDKFILVGPKFSSDVMVVAVASRAALGFFISSGIKVPLSIRV